MTNNNNNLIQKYTDKEKNKEIDALKFTKGFEKAVDLLNDISHYKRIVEGQTITEDIILPYIVFFQLVNSPVIKNYEDYVKSSKNNITINSNNTNTNNNEICYALKETWKDITSYILSEGSKKIGKKKQYKI